ncbi:MAG TPA: prepilin-type N-terminal cleavage/methylation domain-containing protein [Kofleriaceae bacterium]|nr:prepilin-type N-terminal cleavage/methylation domain-containing protein [Kofleriaceae bacterium]
MKRTLSARLLRRTRNAQRGMTLLEIMIVLAILALVMGLVVGPRVMKMFGESKEKIAKLAVDDYAFNAYGSWSQANPSKSCPEKLSDLNEYVNKKETKDPWGTEYKMLCGPNLPAGVKGGLAVESAGPDQKFGTEDDVKSY